MNFIRSQTQLCQSWVTGKYKQTVIPHFSMALTSSSKKFKHISFGEDL
jgi:hypothetical protein